MNERELEKRPKEMKCGRKLVRQLILRGCLYGGGPALLAGLALCRDPASQLNFLSKFIFVHTRGEPALLGEISPRRAGNFHINALKRAGPPRRASKSKLRNTRQSLSWPAFFWITVHFTSSVCLCV